MSKADNPRIILFVCTGNACRSQIAEALLKSISDNSVKVYSAGVAPWPDLHPMATHLLNERGLDISGQQPKHVKEFLDQPLDMVVTIGNRAETETPDFRSNTRRIFWDIDDPANSGGTPDSESVFRSTLNQVENRLPEILRTLHNLLNHKNLIRTEAVSTIITRPTPFDPDRDLPLFAEKGIKAIELTFFYEPWDFQWREFGAIKKLKKIADSLGITILSLHPPDLGLLHDHTRHTQIDVLKQTADMAEELNASTVSIHAGFFLPTEENLRLNAMDLLNQSLDELAEYVQKASVRYCLESLSGAEHLSNREAVNLVTERSAASFGFVLDTGHAHIAGDLQEIPYWLDRRLLNLHISDNDSQFDQHGFPGTGTIDWSKLIATLDHMDYEGPLLLEVQVPKLMEYQNKISIPLSKRLDDCNRAFKFLRHLQKKIIIDI